MKNFIILSAVLIALSFTLKAKKFKGPEGFVFIPSGTIEMEDQKYSCNAFWMSDHEVTNFEYREFLADLKQNDPELYQAVKIDSSLWSSMLPYSFNDPMVNHYGSHPAYNYYPVVNISKKGAQEYCKWLTEKYRSMYGEIIQDFRLPTRMEWMYAAASGTSNKIYPWGGVSPRNTKGCYLMNYRTVGDQNVQMGEDGKLTVADTSFVHDFYDDGAMYTASTKSYQPNDFGLYNMSGNVAEMVAKEDLAVGGSWYSPGYDVRIQSSAKFEGPNPFTGFRPVLSFIKQDN